MKKKYYLVLDTETATLPFANQICENEKQKRNVAIAKPLVYDIAWVIIDRKGDIIKKENFLVQETFFVPGIFNTAYYKEKRPLYMKMLQHKEIKTATWNDMANVLLADLQTVDIISAYNATFDFKKAIPFTERYIKHLYSADYNEWEAKQYNKCLRLVNGDKPEKNPDFLNPLFKFRGETFPIADLWSVTCTKLINGNRYRDFCLKNQLLTASAMYFKSSAETAFQYLMKQYDFTEEHTALSDAIIESQVLAKALKKGAVNPQIEPFPFRNLGTTIDYVQEKRPKFADYLISALEQYIIESGGGDSGYWSKIEKTIEQLTELRDSL